MADLNQVRVQVHCGCGAMVSIEIPFPKHVTDWWPLQEFLVAWNKSHGPHHAEPKKVSADG